MSLAELSRSTRRLDVELLENRWVPGAIRMLPGFNANDLGAVDDASSSAITLPFTLNFEGTTTNTIFVNSNGNLTLNTADPNNKDSASFPLNSVNVPMFMPFWADADNTLGTGNIFFGVDTLFGHQAFAATWINVPAFFQGSTPNSFQVILVDRSDTGAGNFDIEFNYNQITWDTGDASSVSATVGYSNGTNTAGTFFALPGSGDVAHSGNFIDGGPDALISHSLLSNTLGRYHFLVRNGQVVTSFSSRDITGSTRVLFPFRYITDVNTGLERGNLTLVNFNSNALQGVSLIGSGGLDIPISGPITVVFNQLPANITVANASGTTASGHPFISVPVANWPRDNPVLRVQIQLDNPLFNAPTTFFIGQGFSVLVFGGGFDATKA
jgi:hypothetical protein